MSEREKCPKCGSVGGWVRHLKAMGFFEESGPWGQTDAVEGTHDNLRYGPTPRTVKCIDCGFRTTPLAPGAPETAP